MKGSAGLSVTIITRNEAHNIRACLRSVSWADEIIVVDSGSTDGTVAAAREFTPQVYQHDWPGFGAQKNRALSYAGKDWVLSLDADERVTPELRSQIIKAMEDGRENGFYLPRLSQFCGQFVRHSGWYPDYVLRLFKRGEGRFSDDLVHESVILQGSSGRLSSPLLHYSYRNEADVSRKIEQYASAAAMQMHKNGKVVTRADAPARAAWAFARTFFLRLGFLDGLAGIGIARMNARTTYLKYKKLKALQSAQPAL
ncbi:MAG: glycosyltransferase family 2 protein [Nitrosomonadales bacterium]|nr:glycosyltransferase family 2 protein [Nitrosomonadales bacterium]